MTALGWLFFAVAVSANDPDMAPPTSLALTPDSRSEAYQNDLQARVDATPNGGTLFLETGVHAGPILVQRPISIVGRAGTRIVGNGRGTVVTVLTDDARIANVEIRGGGRDAHAGDAGIRVTGKRVTIENVDIRETLMGIDFAQTHDSSIRNSSVAGPDEGPMGIRGDGIRLWESTRNTIADNVVHRVRDVVVWYSEGNSFEGNTVTGGRYGLHFMHSDANQIIGNQLTENVVGVFVMYSSGIVLRDNALAGARGAAGMGVGCKESDRMEIANNRIVDNTTGIFIDACPHRVDGKSAIHNNLIGFNHFGLRFHQVKAGISVTDNEFYENGEAVVVGGRSDAILATFLNNRWSEYAGYDLDGDQIGDLPYSPTGVSRGLMQRRPTAAFFVGTPAAWLLDFLGTAFPMFAPKPLFFDAEPRMGHP